MMTEVTEALQKAIAVECTGCVCQDLDAATCLKGREIEPGILGLELAISDACEDVAKKALLELAKK